MEPSIWHSSAILWKAAYGPKCALNEITMGGTEQKGILKGDQRLWSLHITDKTSKDKRKQKKTAGNTSLGYILNLDQWFVYKLGLTGFGDFSRSFMKGP
jgi:hypothetical protein